MHVVVVSLPVTRDVEESLPVILQSITYFGFLRCFLIIRLKLGIFSKNNTDIVSFSVHHMRKYMISILIIVGGASSDLLAKLMSGQFSLMKRLFLPGVKPISRVRVHPSRLQVCSRLLTPTAMCLSNCKV